MIRALEKRLRETEAERLRASMAFNNAIQRGDWYAFREAHERERLLAIEADALRADLKALEKG